MVYQIPMGTKVLLVEDETIVRGLISEILTSRGFQVFAAEDGVQARRFAEQYQPDVLVVDIQLGAGPNGIDVAHAIRLIQEVKGLVFLTNVPDPSVLGLDSKSIPKHAAYLQKARLSNSDSLVEAIRQTLSGKVLDRYRDDKTTKSAASDLSRSQIEVLQLVAQGKSNQQIADIRGTGQRAVENLLHRAYEAIGLEYEVSSSNLRVKAALAYLEAVGAKRA